MRYRLKYIQTEKDGTVDLPKGTIVIEISEFKPRGIDGIERDYTKGPYLICLIPKKE